MPELSIIDYSVIIFTAFIVGATKTGIPGLGILAVPLMAAVLPAASSVGILLGILILADIFAVIYHRRNAQWSHILRMLPPAIVGIIIGFLAMSRITDKQLKPIIGIIVLIMLGVNYWRTKIYGPDAPIPTQWWFACTLGLVAGVTSMMANAAGPVMIIYLLAMRLPKVAFVGTSAWFFFIVNWIKVPFNASLQSMTRESVILNLSMLPFIALGAVVGIYLLKQIPQRAFVAVVQILTFAAAVKLIIL